MEFVRTAICLSAVALILSGCTNDTKSILRENEDNIITSRVSDNLSYTSYTLLDGDFHFSLQHLTIYEPTMVEISPGHTRIVFSRNDQEQDAIKSYLVVNVISPMDFLPDAKARLELDLRYFESKSDFLIEDQSYITIAGIKTRRWRFSFTEINRLGEPVPYIERIVYLDHNGFIWRISSNEQTEHDIYNWERVLNTFQILD